MISAGPNFSDKNETKDSVRRSPVAFAKYILPHADLREERNHAPENSLLAQANSSQSLTFLADRGISSSARTLPRAQVSKARQIISREVGNRVMRDFRGGRLDFAKAPERATGLSDLSIRRTS